MELERLYCQPSCETLISTLCPGTSRSPRYKFTWIEQNWGVRNREKKKRGRSDMVASSKGLARQELEEKKIALACSLLVV